ncbi:MAG: hypothetical protein ABA06_01165 [Parcubacteria bacterium C7867-001]|nr:MAG: hypothetical protein ABA06_01165 [Parcubacteria bacterium C7867-001]
MITTLVLAQIWGPVLLAVGIGMFVSRAQYQKVYRDIAEEPLAALTFGVFASVIGIMQVLAYSVWDTFIGAILTLLGWGALLKGLVFIMFPAYVAKTSQAFAKIKATPLAAALVTVLGAYLAWYGFLG